MDLPFDGAKLFGEKADSALERFKDSRATAKSLGLQSGLRDHRQFRSLRASLGGSPFGAGNSSGLPSSSNSFPQTPAIGHIEERAEPGGELQSCSLRLPPPAGKQP